MPYLKYSKRCFCLVVVFFLFSGTILFGQQLSDNEIRKNISPISAPLDRIMTLEPISFEYKSEQLKHIKLPSGLRYGFDTNSFQQAFPGLVNTRYYSYMKGKNRYHKAGISTIDMENIIPVIIASIKEQQEEIKKLKAEIEELKRR